MLCIFGHSPASVSCPKRKGMASHLLQCATRRSSFFKRKSHVASGGQNTSWNRHDSTPSRSSTIQIGFAHIVRSSFEHQNICTDTAHLWSNIQCLNVQCFPSELASVPCCHPNRLLQGQVQYALRIQSDTKMTPVLSESASRH